MVKKAHIVFIIFSCLILNFSCRKPGIVDGQKLEEFDIEDQIIIGNTLEDKIEQNSAAFNILEENSYQPAYDYINTLLNTLLFTPMIENRTKFDWDITILRDDTMQTFFTLPGGKIYVYTGLLKYLNSEHEFLGILAHEMYYTDTDLSVLRIKNEFGGFIMGDIVLGNEVEGLSGMTEVIPYLTFAEEEVMEADTYATNIMCLFQYSPWGIWEVIENNSSGLLWLENRSCDENSRWENFEKIILECDPGNVTNEENYYRFKTEYLP